MKNLCYAHHLNMKISVEPIITLFELWRTKACRFRLEPAFYILSRVPEDPTNPKVPANLKFQKFRKNVQINLTT